MGLFKKIYESRIFFDDEGKLKIDAKEMPVAHFAYMPLVLFVKLIWIFSGGNIREYKSMMNYLENVLDTRQFFLPDGSVPNIDLVAFEEIKVRARINHAVVTDLPKLPDFYLSLLSINFIFATYKMVDVEIKVTILRTLDKMHPHLKSIDSSESGYFKLIKLLNGYYASEFDN